MEQLAGSLLAAGSALFLAAACAPVSYGVFTASTVERRLAALDARPAQWRVTQLGFGVGAGLAAIGYLALASAQTGVGLILALIGAALISAGAFLLAKHLWLRTADPVGFAQGEQPRWHFIAYSLLTLAGLLAFGGVYLVAGYPAWLGWLTAGGSLLLFVVLVVTRDLPPLLYYLLTVPAAVVLLV